jgi:hypothetical protein
MTDTQTVRFYATSKETKRRHVLEVSPADYCAVSQRGTRPGKWLGDVHDTLTGQKFRIYSKPCGLGCVCDAWSRKLSL